MESALAALQEAGLRGKRLTVSAAFHSPLVADAKKPFQAALKEHKLSPPKCTVYSNVSAAPYPKAAPKIRKLLADQIVSPVRFVDLVEALYADGHRVFVECGPKGVLSGLLSKTLADDAVIVSLDGSGERVDGDLQLRQLLARLAAEGVPVDVTPLLSLPLPLVQPKLSPATVSLGGANYKAPSTQNPPLPAYPPKPTPQPFVVPAAQAPVPMNVDESSLSGIIAATQQTLRAFQDAQERTARVHAQFLDTHQRATESFSKLFDTHARLVGTATGERPSPPKRPAPPIALASSTRAPGFEQYSTLPSAMDTEGMGEVELPTAGGMLSVATEMPPIFDAQAIMDGAANSAPAAVSTSPPPNGSGRQALVDAMLAAVSEKTGYPEEMLELSMDMEGDLGIDSIKRVEIMAAVQEAVPSLPELDNDRLSALRTLDEVVAYLAELGPGVPEVASTVSASVVPTPAPAPRQGREALVSAMLAAVSEKTGYPEEMLELSMDMEGDLGIDSIKRVEIMAAVQEAVPSLPELDNDRLSALRTLDEVVAYLAELGPVVRTAAPIEEADHAGTAPAPVQAPALTASNAPHVAGVTEDVIVAAMLGSVADKTGYPEEMLELSMDMEGDLGIDSIKRVEIMAAVQEAVPSLPELDNDRLSSLRTLDEVVAYLNELVPVVPSAPAQAAYPSARTVPGSAPRPAPVRKVASAAQRSRLTEAVLSSVAEKTGYPQDMLDLAMDMEGDLGIDSIKRVEIMAAVQEKVPSLPDLDNERLSALRSLDEVVGYLDSLSAAPKAEAKTPTVRVKTAPNALVMPERRVPEIIAAPAGGPVQIEGTLVVTADPSGRSTEVVTALRERGLRAELINPDWTSLKNIKQVLPAGVTGVVHLAAVGATGTELRDRIRGAFLLAKAVGPCDHFITVTAQDGCFGLKDIHEPLQGALAGLTKTLDQEWPSCRCVAIDIHPDVGHSRLVDEILTDRSTVEVGIGLDRVVSLAAVKISLPAGPPQPPIRRGELVVVSGGARGVTAAVVEEMAGRWGCNLLLLGRSDVAESDPAWAASIADKDLKRQYAANAKLAGIPLTPKDLDATVYGVIRAREIRATLKRVRSKGVQVIYGSVDVRRRESVLSAVTDASKRFGPVRGLVHGAGVLADKLVTSKTQKQFDFVFDTKVDGLLTLLEVVDEVNDRDLAFLGLFSSVAGRYGNQGQADYAMANEAITRVGISWAKKGTLVKSFDWGPWEGGMVTPALKRQFEKQGIELIQLRGGAQFFCDEFERPGTTVEVIVGGPHRGGPLVGGKSHGVEVKTLAADAPFLRDHVIGGRPVLPAAMVLEWMVDAARKSRPDLHFAGVREFRVVKGVAIMGAVTALRLTWQPAEGVQPGKASIAFELRGIAGPKGKPSLYYTGVVDLSTSAPLAQPFPGSNGLGAHSFPLGLTEVYEQMLFHGPALQGIDRIVGFSDKGIVGRLHTSQPAQLGGSEAGRWNTDPLTVDAALQLMLVWVAQTRGTKVLPMYVKEYRQYGDFEGTKGITCHLKMAKNDARRGTFDATLVDDHGQVVAELSAGEYVATPQR